MDRCGIEIDPSVCQACFRCVDECPVGAIARATPVTIESEECIGCGHCGAVCAHGAVRSQHGSFARWSAPALDPLDVRSLLTGRRSVRRYQPGGLDAEVVREVLSVGAYTATASNARDVRAIVLQGERLRAVGSAINGYYLRLAHWLKSPLMRPLLWFTAARPYLKHPKRLERLRARVTAFGPGQDWIFFDAPVVVVLTAPRQNRRFGRVNAVIAGEQMQTYAAGLGLGSCWIGYAEVALRGRRDAAKLAEIPGDHEPHGVFTLGRPRVEFQRLPARAPLAVTWLRT